MMTLIAAAVLAAQPAAPAPANPQGQQQHQHQQSMQHMQTGQGAQHKGMDCCKECCKDMARKGHGNRTEQGSSHSGHSSSN